MLEEIKAKLEAELEQLHHELSVTLPEAIRKAVELGDLRENADYKSALDRQQFVSARISHLSQRMSELSRIDVDAMPYDRVGFGSRVRLQNLDTGDEVSYTIVAGDYLDLEANQVSLASPLGRAAVGRAEGEEFVCSLPAGEKRFRVVELTTLPQMLEQDSAGDSGD
jgi:transcription elongation factor GreA